MRIIDLSRVLAGPYCTMILADLGADVIKVEHPELGDETRSWGPPFQGGEASYYLSVNRGKRSCALDLKTEEGRCRALELCAGCDVVVENFKPGTTERFGLGYEQLRERNPEVVYCSVSAYGSGRTMRERPGYDFMLQAESGLMHITGAADGEPTKVGVAIVDVLAGLNVATAVAAALYGRERTGKGERIEVSLLDSGLAALVNVAANALATGEEPGRYGNGHPNIVPYETFHAADRLVAVGAGNDPAFRRLCEVVDAPTLADDARFRTNADRLANRTELTHILEQRFRVRPAGEWLERFASAGVPGATIRGVLEALRAATSAGEPATHTVQHPTAGPLEVVRPPFRLARGGTAPPTSPPLLGEHTDAILAELSSDYGLSSGPDGSPSA